MDQAHASIDQFDCFGMTKGMVVEVKNVSIFSYDLTRHRQSVECQLDELVTHWAPFPPLGCRRKQVSCRIVLLGEVLFDKFVLGRNDGGDLLRNGHFVMEHIRFLSYVECSSSIYD
jgi:hypothetical protein